MDKLTQKQEAKTAYKNSRIEISDHFRQVGKMVEIGSNTKREIEDIMPTSYVLSSYYSKKR